MPKMLFPKILNLIRVGIILIKYSIMKNQGFDAKNFEIII
jgi:hypothetical protein